MCGCWQQPRAYIPTAGLSRLSDQVKLQVPLRKRCDLCACLSSELCVR